MTGREARAPFQSPQSVKVHQIMDKLRWLANDAVVRGGAVIRRNFIAECEKNMRKGWMVEPGGIEPPTSSMPLKRSPN